MQDFKDKVAVVTGGASGIGFALAQHCANKGMKVVLADIEASALAQAEQKLKAEGANVLTCQCDVSKPDDIDKLAQATLDRFGGVHLLFNNAGVGAGTTIWESTLADWEWTLGVNLWGVVHGIRKFVPIMLEQNTPCHIVNTASVAGLIAGPGLGIYKVTKHAVVTLSETLYYELAQKGAQVKVSVLCPGFVKTRIWESGRNRPSELQNEMQPPTPEMMVAFSEIQQLVNTGMPADNLAEIVFDAIREDKLYILTHPEFDGMIEQRMNSILNDGKPPLS
jgi:NAD(P)-dependent dehydrogenase (short-subunit alcohol dehydrogenase family)